MLSSNQSCKLASKQALNLASQRPRVVAVANQKGGVGKTTITLLVADALTVRGRRVLVVDLDPQANATSGAGAEPGTRTMADVLLSAAPIRDAVVPGAWGFDVAVSSIDLASKERSRRLADEHDLRRALDGIDGYDVVLIDCPPSVGVLTVNALAAADEVLVVADPSYFALVGVGQISDTVAIVREHYNPNLELRVVLNLVDTTVESQTRIREARRVLGAALIDVTVPRRVVVKEAVSCGVPLRAFGTRKDADRVAHAVSRLTDAIDDA